MIHILFDPFKMTFSFSVLKVVVTVLARVIQAKVQKCRLPQLDYCSTKCIKTTGMILDKFNMTLVLSLDLIMYHIVGDTKHISQMHDRLPKTIYQELV